MKEISEEIKSKKPYKIKSKNPIKFKMLVDFGPLLSLKW